MIFEKSGERRIRASFLAKRWATTPQTHFRWEKKPSSRTTSEVLPRPSPGPSSPKLSHPGWFTCFEPIRCQTPGNYAKRCKTCSRTLSDSASTSQRFLLTNGISQDSRSKQEDCTPSPPKLGSDCQNRSSRNHAQGIAHNHL